MSTLSCMYLRYQPGPHSDACALELCRAAHDSHPSSSRHAGLYNAHNNMQFKTKCQFGDCLHFLKFDF